MNREDFKKMRKAARFTQEQMGARLGYSRQAVIDWEKGKHAIPDDVLDKLIERSLSAEPEPIAPITPKTHPGLYDAGVRPNTFTKNHKHPRWWASVLWDYMTNAQQQHVETMAGATTADLELDWTPERAIAFTMTFVRKTRAEAEKICRDFGFDIPAPPDPLADYKRDRAQYLHDYPNGGWTLFEELYPQHKEHRATVEQSAEQVEAAQRVIEALDSAFSLSTPNQDN